ncbi:hypothetical protein LEMLEM_LOCUS7336 [Lemmus lemmus]
MEFRTHGGGSSVKQMKMLFHLKAPLPPVKVFDVIWFTCGSLHLSHYDETSCEWCPSEQICGQQ